MSSPYALHFYFSMTRTIARIASFLILFSLFFWGISTGPGTMKALAQGGDQPLGPVGKAYRGQSLFSQRCASCHGEQGDGKSELADKLPDTLPDFTARDYTQGKSPQFIFDVITNGRMDRMMPPWGNELSEEARWDLTAYIWSLSQSPHRVAAAERIYEQQCASCHGSSGAGVEADVPDLRDPKWLQATDDEMVAAVTSEAHPTVEGLQENDLPALVLAVRRFSLGFDQTQVAVEGTGDVSVLAKNGTTGEILAQQPVRLLIFQQEQFVNTKEGVTDDKGRVHFTGLPTNPTWAYIAETTYHDLPYHSEVGQFTPGQETLEMTVAVYDPGATRDAISIDRAHWLIDISTPGFVDVGEVYVFANSANRVYTGERPDPNAAARVLEIPLPEDAVGINVEGQAMGDRFQLDGTTVIDTQPLAPGTVQIFLRYALPVTHGQVTLGHPLPYYTRMLNLLAPDVGISVDAPDWNQDDPISTQGGDFLNYTLFDLPAGASPQAVISGISEKTITSDQEKEAPREVVDRNAAPGISGFPAFPWIVSGVGVLLLVASMALGWRKHQQTLAAMPLIREEQKKALTAQIAALDEAFEAGELPRDQYDEQRNLLKLQLIALLQEEHAARDDEVSLTALAETPKIHPEEEAASAQPPSPPQEDAGHEHGAD